MFSGPETDKIGCLEVWCVQNKTCSYLPLCQVIKLLLGKYINTSHCCILIIWSIWLCIRDFFLLTNFYHLIQFLFFFILTFLSHPHCLLITPVPFTHIAKVRQLRCFSKLRVKLFLLHILSCNVTFYCEPFIYFTAEIKLIGLKHNKMKYARSTCQYSGRAGGSIQTLYYMLLVFFFSLNGKFTALTETLCGSTFRLVFSQHRLYSHVKWFKPGSGWTRLSDKLAFSHK